MNNIYYILQLPQQALNAILADCVESLDTLRYSVDKSKCVVKLPIGAEKPQALNGFISYTHSEILVEMAKPEWSPEK